MTRPTDTPLATYPLGRGERGETPAEAAQRAAIEAQHEPLFEIIEEDR
ncbi:hypothetical protein [Nocardia farcinica]|uniref:Uncharacterized protein n=1 Tax=Nocardia farcinica (strain IFM 10152) TaxID=247156 RepID=Q5Z3X9_NOCFA|nr:hypothetical protein [Nocardia farcinica]BAD54862.1 hypothetical protein NFA_200 [Nocardia farcinica IFM 10152]